MAKPPSGRKTADDETKMQQGEVTAGSDDTTPSTLRTHIVKVLRSQILSGRYRPGERLNESQIAREFNVSRIPVREALSQLQEQGLVMNHERRGMFVMQLSPEEVQQINSLRLVLENEAMLLARANMTPEIMAELTDLVDQMEAWQGPLIDAAALDRKFHKVIWAATGNPYLQRMLDSLTTSLFAHKALEHVSQEIRRWRLNHHRALLDALVNEAADPQMALLTHFRMAYNEPERFSSLAIGSKPRD
ncbi:GntR family transcriptional regulator [Sphingomonas sp.]|uniref:GntR family transcriptional regulator n=1 Tax=Sphingomonas sp. TaxID=28214 RepID=UPI0025EBD829|nr:GntR family transcriptional regulator [Sphingomonas sp.]